MDKFVLFTSVLALFAASSAYFYQAQNSSLPGSVPSHVILAFDQWKLNQGRIYSSPQEQEYRLRLFYQNYKLVAEVNSKKLSYTFGLNAYSDLSSLEFNAKYLQKPVKLDKVTPLALEP